MHLIACQTDKLSRNGGQNSTTGWGHLTIDTDEGDPHELDTDLGDDAEDSVRGPECVEVPSCDRGAL